MITELCPGARPGNGHIGGPKWTPEGRLRRAVRRGNAFHDAILMSVLKEEWEDEPLSP